MAGKDELSPEVKERLKTEYQKTWRQELRRALSVKERSKIPRQKMPERPAEVRIKDFCEVNLGLEAEAAQMEAKRCLDCANPACVKGCPVFIDIPSFVKLIEVGGFRSCCSEDKRNQQPACNLWSRLSSRDSMRSCLQFKKGHWSSGGHWQS